MKVAFEYDKEKDVWCLLNRGKSSNNSQLPTKVYERLVTSCGENPTPEATATFIDEYIADNGIDVQQYITKYQEDWDTVADEYQKRAEAIFGVFLPNDVKGYLTVNNRCPYSIDKDYFFVSMPTSSARRTTMHELWHFYTWYGLGTTQEEKLGKQKYNDLKEALTVLLNVECRDLMPEGMHDDGYPQHKELREKILQFWAQDRDINKLWTSLAFHYFMYIKISD